MWKRGHVSLSSPPLCRPMVGGPLAAPLLLVVVLAVRASAFVPAQGLRPEGAASSPPLHGLLSGRGMLLLRAGGLCARRALVRPGTAGPRGLAAMAAGQNRKPPTKPAAPKVSLSASPTLPISHCKFLSESQCALGGRHSNCGIRLRMRVCSVGFPQAL